MVLFQCLSILNPVKLSVAQGWRATTHYLTRTSTRTSPRSGYSTLLNFLCCTGLAGDDTFFDEDFNKDFTELESGNKFYNKIEDGFKNWEERYTLN
jgi:hypothetical protein